MDACKTSDWNGCLIHKNMCFHQLAWRMSPPVFSYQLTLLLMSYMRTFSHLTGCSVDDWQEESNQGVWNEKKKCHIHKSQFEVNPFKTVRPYNTQARSRWWAGRLEPIQFELHGGEVDCLTTSWSICFTTTTFNALHEQINLTDKYKRPWALWRIIKHGFPLYILRTNLWPTLIILQHKGHYLVSVPPKWTVGRKRELVPYKLQPKTITISTNKRL